MSLKEFPNYPSELVVAISDLTRGKRSAPGRMYKYVKNGTISIEEYNELIAHKATSMLYNEVRRRKHHIYLFNYPIEDYLQYLLFFLTVGIVCVLWSVIEPDNYLARISTVCIALLFVYNNHSAYYGKRSRDWEISELEQENQELKSILSGKRLLMKKDMERFSKRFN